MIVSIATTAVAAPASANPTPSTTYAAQVAQYEASATAAQNADLAAQLQRRPGGTRINAKELAYDNGKVVYSAGPDSLSDCPGGYFSTDWSCLYDGSNNTGRMLKFQDAGSLQSLAPYNFVNMASSWANTRGENSYLHQNTNGSGYDLCLPGGSHSTQLGSPYNNSSGSIYLATNTSGC